MQNISNFSHFWFSLSEPPVTCSGTASGSFPIPVNDPGNVAIFWVGETGHLSLSFASGLCRSGVFSNALLTSRICKLPAQNISMN
jgi:hypothetical protein